MTSPRLLVTYDARPEARELIEKTIGDAAEVAYLNDLADEQRTSALSQATTVLALNTAKELRDGEADLLTNANLIQFISSGVDFIPLGVFPDSITIASNGGGYAEPMAEHAVMMALAAFKRLIIEHNKLAEGDFGQFRRNRMLAGSVCGILGFGGIGKLTAKLMSALGVKVHAINRSGTSDAEVDWIGTDSDLDYLFEQSDIIVLSLPLTPVTEGMIGAAELARMKPDAVIINLARGEIINEAALFAHLQSTPTFTACIDAWWVEPVRHGHFKMDHPFTTLPNVIASPHNSASVGTWRGVALSRAVENVLRVLKGDTANFIVQPADRML